MATDDRKGYTHPSFADPKDGALNDAPDRADTVFHERVDWRAVGHYSSAQPRHSLACMRPHAHRRTVCHRATSRRCVGSRA